MSSATVVIRIVDVFDDILEFWAAEVPRGADGAFSQRIGQDHPVFGLMMLAQAGAIDGLDWAEPSELNARLSEHVRGMELVTTAGGLSYTTGADVVAAIAARPSWREAVLECAPRALYRLQVVDAAALSRFQAGQVFDSTAYSPLPTVNRPASHNLARPGPFGPLLEARGRLVAHPGWHLFRDGEEADIPWRLESWAAKHRIFLSNTLRELFLRRGQVQLVYFDPSAPGFKKGKLRFKKGLVWPGEIPGRDQGPRGVFLQAPWRWGDPVRGPDGVPRAPIDFLHPDGVAWVDLEGEALLRVGSWEGVEARAAGVGLADYLAAVTARIEADAARGA